MTILKNKLQIFVTLVFLGSVGWWISFQHVIHGLGASILWFENTEPAMALIGAVVGFLAFRKWGRFKTILGKSLLFLSLGLFGQMIAQLIDNYYLQVDKIPTPYPSFGDIASFISLLLYICGALFLARTAGVKSPFKKPAYKIIAIVLPLISVAIVCAILLHSHGLGATKLFTVFLDIAFSAGEACYIAIAIIAYFLSRKLLGGVMKSGILLLILALTIQYVSDFTFGYQSFYNTYVTGSYDDLLYLIAYFVMATAMIRFLVIYKAVSSASNLPASTKLAEAVASASAYIGVFNQIAEKIIIEQESIIGPVAVERAQLVKDLHIDWSQHRVTIAGDPQAVIDRLVAQYKVLFGGIAVKACKEAAAHYASQLPDDQVPTSLQ